MQQRSKTHALKTTHHTRRLTIVICKVAQIQCTRLDVISLVHCQLNTSQDSRTMLLATVIHIYTTRLLNLRDLRLTVAGSSL